MSEDTSSPLPTRGKSIIALFLDPNDPRYNNSQARPRAEQRPPSASEEPLTLPTFYATAVTMESKELKKSFAGVDRDSKTRGALESGATVSPQRMSKSLSREGRSRISALSPAEVGEELSRMGLGSNLVSILQENGVRGADLLALTNADLIRMGIQEWYARDLVMRTIAYMQTSEEEHQDLMVPLSRIGDDPPTYSQ
ncbi:hypothetical protein HDU96_006963 [Phlyctochytrium bullatum]|nr:hypothetical protein HDU96_006963 [Phlyctochytrium bullatum]